MKRLLLICLLFSGCATAQDVGTKPWLDAKKAEYDQAYKDGKIDYYQHKSLMAQAEQARSTIVAGKLAADDYQPMKSGNDRPMPDNTYHP